MTTDPHPEELLAPYVDGELEDGERRAVEAHLAGCARCREEVTLARASVARLRALPELEAPAGLASRALAESGGGERAATAARPPRGARWVPAAAAAVLVALVAVVALRPGGGTQEAATSGGNPFASPRSAAEGAIAPSASSIPAPQATEATRLLDRTIANGVHLERKSLDYSTDEIQALTDDSATRFRGATVPGTKGASSSFSAADTAATLGAEEKTALDCVQTQVAPTSADALVRLIEARYQGAPAYLAVVVEAPGPGETANEVIVWIVRKDGCTIANFAFRRL
jgi:hypothetical protein